MSGFELYLSSVGCLWQLLSIIISCILLCGSIFSLLNLSLVAWLEYLLHVPASWRFMSSFPLWWAIRGFHVCLLSTNIGIMITSLHLCGSVRTEWSDVVIDFQEFSYCWFVQVCQHFICGTIWSYRLLAFWLAAALTSLSVIFFPCFCHFLFGVSCWLGCYLHLHIYRISVSCIFACHHSFSRLLQLSNCSCHSIVWHVSQASDNTVQDSVWMIWFSIFSLKLLSYG